jgi:hypothetical protein
MNNLIFTTDTSLHKTGKSVRDSYREVLTHKAVCCNIEEKGKIFIKNANVPKVVNPLKKPSVILDCSNNFSLF